MPAILPPYSAEFELATLSPQAITLPVCHRNRLFHQIGWSALNDLFRFSLFPAAYISRVRISSNCIFNHYITWSLITNSLQLNLQFLSSNGIIYSRTSVISQTFFLIAFFRCIGIDQEILLMRKLIWLLL